MFLKIIVYDSLSIYSNGFDLSKKVIFLVKLQKQIRIFLCFSFLFFSFSKLDLIFDFMNKKMDN